MPIPPPSLPPVPTLFFNRFYARECKRSVQGVQNNNRVWRKASRKRPSSGTRHLLIPLRMSWVMNTSTLIGMMTVAPVYCTTTMTRALRTRAMWLRHLKHTWHYHTSLTSRRHWTMASHKWIVSLQRKRFQKLHFYSYSLVLGGYVKKHSTILQEDRVGKEDPDAWSTAIPRCVWVCY